jgi:hypothetical protein
MPWMGSLWPICAASVPQTSQARVEPLKNDAVHYRAASPKVAVQDPDRSDPRYLSRA